MSSEDLCFLSANELAPLIQQREISPVELVEAYLERIDSLDATVHAYLYVARDEARQAARDAEREIAGGRYRGPLHGIPGPTRTSSTSRACRLRPTRD